MKIKTETVWLIINIYINLFKVLSIHIIVYCSHYLKHCRQRVDLLLRSINKVLFWSIYGKNTRGNLLNLSHSQSRSAMNDKQSYFFALKIMKWKEQQECCFFLLDVRNQRRDLSSASNKWYISAYVILDWKQLVIS